MLCPTDGTKLKCVDSRPGRTASLTKRRYTCPSCGGEFYSTEVLVSELQFYLPDELEHARALRGVPKPTGKKDPNKLARPVSVNVVTGAIRPATDAEVGEYLADVGKQIIYTEKKGEKK